MTSQAFFTRRAWGQIHPDARVRTVIFRFKGGTTEWAEVFVDGRYETIQQQEDRFRRGLKDAVVFITPPEIETVPAKDWVLFS